MEGHTTKSDSTPQTDKTTHGVGQENPKRAPSPTTASIASLAAALSDLRLKINEDDPTVLGPINAGDFVTIACALWRQTGDLSRGVRYTGQPGVVTVFAAPPQEVRTYSSVASATVGAVGPAGRKTTKSAKTSPKGAVKKGAEQRGEPAVVPPKRPALDERRRKAYLACITALKRTKGADRLALFEKFGVNKDSIRERIDKMRIDELGHRSPREPWLLSLGLIPESHLTSWYDMSTAEEMRESAAKKADGAVKKAAKSSLSEETPVEAPAKSAAPKPGPAPKKSEPQLPPKPKTKEAKAAAKPSAGTKAPAPATKAAKPAGKAVGDKAETKGAKAPKAKGPAPAPVLISKEMNDADMSLLVNLSEVLGAEGLWEEDGTPSLPSGMAPPFVRLAARKALRLATLDKYLESGSLCSPEDRSKTRAVAIDDLKVSTQVAADHAVRVRWALPSELNMPDAPVMQAFARVFVRKQASPATPFAVKVAFERTLAGLSEKTKALVEASFIPAKIRPAPPKKEGASEQEQKPVKWIFHSGTQHAVFNKDTYGGPTGEAGKGVGMTVPSTN
ncbi:unnamed protein product [Chilo suppressalis]|uniref:Uncharacterized protein n=1 Tax=Chilo suppressalis TaxID=168631 RepID=A0ABN8B2J7_CHISP|nr:unnamed protein product [Chilo suppressalis]